MEKWWITNARLITPEGIRLGAIELKRGRIIRITSRKPATGKKINLRGAFVSPGWIDLHVWGSSAVLAKQLVRTGTTGFLVSVAPDAPSRLRHTVEREAQQRPKTGARFHGLHLEGPFLSAQKAGALPARYLRLPTLSEARALVGAGGRRIRLMTLAPELAGAFQVIRFLRRSGVTVSLGHTQAAAQDAQRAVDCGARAVTHVFNAMPALHHRRSSCLSIALQEDRLITMVIADGVHVSKDMLRLLVQLKGPGRVALVTDSMRFSDWALTKKRGAFYRSDATLAGSAISMRDALRNVVQKAGCSLVEAVRMASETPARLLGLQRSYGSLSVGKRADLVAFDSSWKVLLTLVDGKIAYNRV